MNTLHEIPTLLITLIPALGFFTHTIIENKLTDKFSFKKSIIFLGIYTLASLVLNIVIIPDYVWWGGLIQTVAAFIFFFIIVVGIGNKVSGASITGWTALISLIPYPYMLTITGSSILTLIILSLVFIRSKKEIETIATQTAINRLDYSYLPDHKEGLEEGGKRVFVPNLMLIGVIVGICVEGIILSIG